MRHIPSQIASSTRHSPLNSVGGHKTRIVYKADGSAAGEELVTADDLLGGTLAFGAEPELGALGLLVLGAEDGGGEADMVNGVFLLAGVAQVYGQSSGMSS